MFPERLLDEHPKNTIVIKPTIYFAHPFDKQDTIEEKEIEEVLSKRGYDVVNPFKEQQEEKLNEKYGVKTYYDKPTFEFAKEIFDKDKKLVLECDHFFGWFPQGITIVGSAVELNWAYENWKKIFCLSYKPQPFLWVMSDVLYTSLEDFKNDVRRYSKTVQ